MKKLFLGVALFMGMLTGCNSQDHSANQDGGGKSLEPVEVTIKTEPEKINPNEEVKIIALVTQGKEKVADANEVKFEIWKSEQEDHSMKPAHNDGKGIYSITTSFKEDGHYFITAHVTARSMHTMPNKEITVGTPVEEHSEAGEHHHSDEHHHDSSVSIELLGDKPFHVNKETILTALVKHENTPLTNAKVTFEVWAGEEQKHEWIDAKETGGGKYTAAKTFTRTGAYHVQIHVENDELHEHNVIMFEVK